MEYRTVVFDYALQDALIILFIITSHTLFLLCKDNASEGEGALYSREWYISLL